MSLERERQYLCIDMKTFYASVECAERHLDPFGTDLVVADVTRGKNALCLAVSPHLKAQGVRNRCRISEIPARIRYIVAPPRMALYIEYAADIYSLYLDYFAPMDMHVYSIDETFIDVTGYLPLYRTDATTLASGLLRKIASRLHIPATAGIGTNLYLAKVALDITAKHSRDHIGYLDEALYRQTLWDHRPLTDFWMIAAGTAKRLAHLGIFDMRGVASADAGALYRTFGINAELLIDHAWGRESCRMEDIKSYRPKSRSVSFSQILPRNYTFGEARTVVEEMVIHGADELMRRKEIAQSVGLYVGYAWDTVPPSGAGTSLPAATSLASAFLPHTLTLFDRIADREAPIRRLGLNFGGISAEGAEGYDLFTDTEAIGREDRLQRTVLGVKDRFGRNAVLPGICYLPEATERERNRMIGGHRAGTPEEIAAARRNGGQKG